MELKLKLSWEWEGGRFFERSGDAERRRGEESKGLSRAEASIIGAQIGIVSE